MTPRAEKGALVCLGACLLLYSGFALPLVPVASDDIRMAGVFSLDEAAIADVVRHLYRKGFSEPPSYKYGALSYYVPLVLLKAWGLVALSSVVLMFLLAFALTNPHALMQLGRFRESVLNERGIIGFGQTFREDTRGTLWISMLVGMIGRFNGLLLVGYAAVGVWALLRRRRLAADRAALLLCGSWCLPST